MLPNVQLIVILGLLSLVAGFASGYKVKSWQIQEDNIQTLKIEAEKQDKISVIVDQVVTKTIDDVARTEIVTKTIEKEVIRYVPKIQLVNSKCNLTNGVVRMLNDHASNKIPPSPIPSIETDTTSSTITEKEHIDYTNEIIGLYNKAAIQANALIEYNIEVNKLNP